MPEAIVFPSTKGRLPKQIERKNDKYNILNYIKQGIDEIATIESKKSGKYKKVLQEFEERFIAKELKQRKINYETITEKEFDDLFQLYVKSISRFKSAVSNRRREIKDQQKLEEENKYNKKEEEAEIKLLLDGKGILETKFSTSQRDKVSNYILTDITKNKPLKIMKQTVEGTKFKNYYGYFEYFYKWYLPKAATFNNMEAGMEKFIALLKSGELRRRRDFKIKSSGINNYIKAYNFYVKTSGVTSLKQIKLIRVEDRKDQTIITPDLQTQANMDKLRSKYKDKEQLTAFNLAFYFGLHSTEIAAIHDSEFKKVATKDKIPEHYVVTTRNASKPVTTFNQYMIQNPALLIGNWNSTTPIIIIISYT